MLRRLAVLLALASSSATFACSASSADEQVDDSADSITSEQAAQQFRGAQHLGDFAAGSATRDLGVRSWSAYAVNDAGFRGAVLFAVDGAGDVRYGVLAGTRESIKGTPAALVVLDYDKSGRTAASTADPPTLEALRNDVVAVQKALADIRGEAIRTCAQSIAVIALGGIAIAAGSWIAGTGAAAIAGTTWIGSVLSSVAGLGGTLVHVGGYAAITLGSVAASAELWLDVTNKSCVTAMR